MQDIILTVSSTLLILHEAHISKQTGMGAIFNHAGHAEETADIVAKSREEIPSRSGRPIESCVKEASPFLTTLLYLDAVAILRIHRKERSQKSLERLTIMKAALKEFDQRWRSSGELHKLVTEQLLIGNAGAYLEILEAREISSS